MSHIYWELKEIPIPKDQGAKINNNDGRVYIFLDKNKPVKESKRVVIGRATSETTMHPNDNFKYFFPSLWEEHYGKRTQEHSLAAGLYAFTLASSHNNNLYPILHKVYGPLYANALMDYSMFSIRENSDSSINYEDSMHDKVIFSKDRYSDTWLSDFFKTKMSASQNEEFKREWLQNCKDRGITKAWISIDGSNNNCSAEKCTLAEKGAAKSKLNINIVSYIVAISSVDGTPITFDVNPGGMVDSKAIMKIISRLVSYGIETEGVILDRGFCSHNVIDTLNKEHINYVVMLHSDDYGHKEMLNKYGDSIRWKVPYAISDKGLFGVSEKMKLFASHPEEAYISLFFDASNGTDRSITLIRKILNAKTQLLAAKAKGECLTVPSGVEKYISIQDGRININYNLWQREIDTKGFCSIATSFECEPDKVDYIYHLRDISEKQFMIYKSQLGFDVTRVHFTSGVENKLVTCFIASIIRSALMKDCLSLSLCTSKIIRELDRIQFFLHPSGKYIAIHNEKTRIKDLLQLENIDIEDLDYIASEVSDRYSNPIVSQYKEKPTKEKKERKKPGRPKSKKPMDEIKPKRKRGRPRKEKIEEVKEKRKPGRPKGSKNKPKTKK